MEIFVFVSEQWLLITLLAALIGIFFISEQNKSGKSLGSSELVRLMNKDEAVVVDVRTTAEYENGHIHGALSIPHLKLASRIAELEKEFARVIHHMGDPENFENQVRELIGGIEASQRASDEFLSKQAQQWGHPGITKCIFGKRIYS